MVKNWVKNYLYRHGYTIIKNFNSNFVPIEFFDEDLDLINDVRANDLSMTSTLNLYSTVLACKYIIQNEIEGDFVECGVFRGGHSIIAAELFRRYKVEKKVYLFDTFQGMTKPSEFDIKTTTREPAIHKYNATYDQKFSHWAYASLDEVKGNFKKRQINKNVIFIQGDVIETLQNKLNYPQAICFLRLDTDWYDSTKKELEVLYPHLVQGGILVIDDYGSWEGVRKAVDEYFYNNKAKPYFSLIDSAARISVKQIYE